MVVGSEQESGLSKRIAQLKHYRAWSDAVQQQTGKSRLEQVQEILALRRLGGRCGVSDYYWYRLYDPSYHRGRGSADYLGWSLQEAFSVALNPRYAVLPASDKLMFTQLARSAGLPVAPVKATYHPARTIDPGLGQHLKSVDAVAQFLRNPANFPVFGKPAYSQQGYGAAYLASYDPATDQLVQLNGGRIAVTEFVQRLTRTVNVHFHKPECGYLFQECFKLHPEIAELAEWSALCGVRVMCLNTPDGAKILRSFWKIAVPPNQVDNFSMGKYGNLLADVDPATGEVGRVLGAFWPEAKVLTDHPQSGKRITGYRLPGWERILDACNTGAAAFPLMKIHHWDFVLTDQGPLILELNDIASTQAAQIHGHGLLTEFAREFLKTHASVRWHPWVRDV